MFKYFDKIETKYKTVLASLSGAQMGSNHEKHIQVQNLVNNTLCICVCV